MEKFNRLKTNLSGGLLHPPSFLSLIVLLKPRPDSNFCFHFFRILFHQERPFNHRYDFIFDRSRAVRQEVVIQNLPCHETVKLLEPIVMFMSLSMYRLNGSPMSVFDPKICLQHLQECLLKCLTCYDEMDQTKEDYVMENRVIIEGIYLMLNMEETSALQRLIKLTTPMKENFIIRQSIKIAINFHLNSFYKVLQGIQELPHLLSAVASLQIPRIRKKILHVFSIAYNSSTLSVDFLQRLLIYDELELLQRDLKNLGVSDENNPTKLVIRRTKFDISKSIVS